MNVPTVTALIVALCSLLGVAWTIWNGRRTFLNKKNISMFGEAKQIIEQYKTQVAELTNESTRQREEIEQLKRKNWQLMRLLSRAWNVPLDFVELQLERDDPGPLDPPTQPGQPNPRDPFRPPRPGSPANRPRKPNLG